MPHGGSTGQRAITEAGDALLRSPAEQTPAFTTLMDIEALLAASPSLSEVKKCGRRST
jgi:hypothetical protein